MTRSNAKIYEIDWYQVTKVWEERSRRPKYPEGHLNKKDGLTRYGDSHVKDKTS